MAQFKFEQVERKPSKRGRKVSEKPNMVALIKAWGKFKVGMTIPLPDGPADDSHSAVSNARHHFKKYAEPAGIIAGVDYTIESHPDHGATITRKK